MHSLITDGCNGLCSAIWVSGTSPPWLIVRLPSKIAIEVESDSTGTITVFVLIWVSSYIILWLIFLLSLTFTPVYHQASEINLNNVPRKSSDSIKTQFMFNNEIYQLEGKKKKILQKNKIVSPDSSGVTDYWCSVALYMKALLTSNKKSPEIVTYSVSSIGSKRSFPTFPYL